MYCFSCWHHEIWQYFSCWFANNIHIVFSWCLSVQEIRILCHQKEEISISKSKITIASLGFLVDSWRKLCKSCEKSQQDELLLQAPTCPCWQCLGSFFYPTAVSSGGCFESIHWSVTVRSQFSCDKVNRTSLKSSGEFLPSI